MNTIEGNNREQFLRDNYSYETVLERNDEPSFSEFVVKRGGDVCIFRVHDTDTGYKIYQR